jgi:hypothetical protein
LKVQPLKVKNILDFMDAQVGSFPVRRVSQGNLFHFRIPGRKSYLIYGPVYWTCGWKSDMVGKGRVYHFYAFETGVGLRESA